jgi:hypothetical protein
MERAEELACRTQANLSLLRVETGFVDCLDNFSNRSTFIGCLKERPASGSGPDGSRDPIQGSA